MKRITTLLFILLSLGAIRLNGQDIHFSQHFASPLTVNPANTGMFKGDYRIGANYRQQWASVTVPYRTFAGYGDIGIGKGAMNNYFVGAGMSVISDHAGDGNLSVTKVMASGAFHMAVDRGRYNYISIGLQAGWVQKRIDWSKLYFDNQWDEREFNQQLPSGEKGYVSGFGYPDMSLGVMYSFGASQKFSAYGGLAAYHLIKPSESFYKQDNNLGIRPVATGGATIKVNDNLSFYPSMYYMSQKKASEFMFGSLLSYDFNGNDDEHNRFFAGAHLRLKDAWYPVVGYEYHNVRALFNYDVNFSELKPASSGKGAWEISIVYIGNLFKKPPRVLDIPCPRF